MGKPRSIRHAAALATVGVAATLGLTVGMGVAANAAYLSVGNVTCMQDPQEIHTTSTAKGDVYHEIYGGWQRIQAWPMTNRVTVGYSSTYSNWDAHHWLFYKNESGGKVVGSSGVTQKGIRCA